MTLKSFLYGVPVPVPLWTLSMNKSRIELSDLIWPTDLYLQETVKGIQ